MKGLKIWNKPKIEGNMCKECEKWKEKASSIWKQVFKQMETFQFMVNFLSEDMIDDYRNQKPNHSLEEINGNIDRLAEHPYDNDEYYEIYGFDKNELYNNLMKEREQIITIGQKWIDFFKKQIDWAINVMAQKERRKKLINLEETKLIKEESIEWGNTANSIWNQVFVELIRLKTLVQRLPQPIKENLETTVIQKIDLDPEKINKSINEMCHPPGMITQEEWNKTSQNRNEIISNAQKWLDYLKDGCERIEIYPKIKEAANEWGIAANIIWNQVFTELTRFKTLVQRLPQPIKENWETNIIRKFDLDPAKINKVINEMRNPQIGISLEDWNKTSQIPLSNAQKWLDFFKIHSEDIETFLKQGHVTMLNQHNQEISLMEMQNRNHMFNEIMSTINSMNAENARTQEHAFRALHESAQGYVDALGGRPVIDLRFRRYL